MAADIIELTVESIERSTPAWRHAALSLPASEHARLFQEAACLHQIEVRPPSGEVRSPTDPLRILAWNAERLKFVEASAELLATLDADILLLSEVDLGMARSGNRHTTRDLADALGMGYAFGVEFVELGLGDPRERAQHAGQQNADGLHGGAILSRLPIEQAWLIRLEQDGHWFGGDRKGERRIGGRIAMVARIRLSDSSMIVVAPHFESHSDPAHRAVQMNVMLAAIDKIAGELPVLIGGDLNSKSMTRDAWRDPDGRQRLLDEDPERLMHPQRHEPLFEIAKRHGYQWLSAEPAVPTERPHPDDLPKPLGRIDWIFERGINASRHHVEPALASDGSAISDHEILLAEFDSLTMRG